MNPALYRAAVAGWLALGLLMAGCQPPDPPVQPGSAPAAGASPTTSVAAIASTAHGHPPAPDLPAGWASLSGSVTFPSEDLPPMRVCAISAVDAGTAYCMDTALQQSDWWLRVPPGGWGLVAYPKGDADGQYPGRYSRASACLAAAGTGCDEHALESVEVAAGQARAGITINDWYGEPHDGEIGPQEPRGEVVPAL